MYSQFVLFRDLASIEGYNGEVYFNIVDNDF